MSIKLDSQVFCRIELITDSSTNIGKKAPLRIKIKKSLLKKVLFKEVLFKKILFEEVLFETKELLLKVGVNKVVYYWLLFINDIIIIN